MSRPLRVLHVLAELKPSGAETMLVAAAGEFRKQGVEAEVLSIGTQTGPFVGEFEAAGYPIHHIPFSRSPSFFLRQWQLMNAGRYDVVHLHCEAANFWQGLVACSARPPVIVRTIHNAFAFEGGLRRVRGMQRRLLNRMGVRHVAISASVSENETQRYGLPTTLIWNWYNSARFTLTTAEARAEARRQFALDDKDFVIASIGNCSPVKNHDAIIEAMALVGPQACLVYLHAGLEQPGQPERDLASRLGLTERIRFLGGVKDVLPLLRAADAFLMPSVYEGFGIAAIEAVATGLPALLTEVDGLRDFRDVFPGLIYTDTTAKGVAAGIQALINLPREAREALRQHYPEVARLCYGMERGVAEYLALYRDRARG